MKRILSYIIIFLLILIRVPEVSASSFVDINETGSISFTLVSNDNYFEDVDIMVYHIANLNLSNNYINYTYTDDFADYSDNFEDNINSNKLLKYINSNNIEGITITTNDLGKSTLDSLPLGVYLVVQISEIPNYKSFTPTVVYLPSLEGDNYIYDIDITPKIDIEYLHTLTIKKVWNDNISKHDEVTVKISNDKEEYEVVLNESNDWTYIWTSTETLDNYNIEEINVPSDYTATYKINENTLTITNSKNLLQTGLEIIPIVTIFVIGLILISLGIKLRNEEEVK